MLRAHHGIGLCTLALLVLGLVMVNSAGMGVSDTDPASPVQTLRDVLESRPAIYAMLALAAMTFAWALPIRSMLRGLAGRSRGGADEPGDGGREPASAITLLVCATLVVVSIAALVYIPGLSREVNGSRRWLTLPLPGLGPTSAQPSEIVKWLAIPILAWFCVAQRAHMGSFLRGGGPAMVALGLMAAVIAKEDLGTGVLIAAAGGAVLLAGGLRVWQAALSIPIGAAGVALAVYDEPYRFERLETFLNPYADPQDAGYHMIQSMAAIAGGGGPGRGLGNGLQKFGYLPEDQTDFLFAIICEELGIAGAVVVCGLIGACLLSILCIAWKEREPLARLVAIGVAAIVGVQALINLFVVTGLAPTKGIPLPLVSSGGTGWILTAASLGAIMSLGRTQPLEPELAEDLEDDEIDDEDLEDEDPEDEGLEDEDLEEEDLEDEDAEDEELEDEDFDDEDSEEEVEDDDFEEEDLDDEGVEDDEPADDSDDDTDDPRARGTLFDRTRR